MKCPQCGIHYDDSEKECPVCGARKPLFQKDASKLSKPSGKISKAQGKKATALDMGSAAKSKADADTSWIDSLPLDESVKKEVGNAVTSVKETLRSKSKKSADSLNEKKKGGIGAVVIVIVVLILVNVLPAIFTAVSRMAVPEPDITIEPVSEDDGLAAGMYQMQNLNIMFELGTASYIVGDIGGTSREIGSFFAEAADGYTQFFADILPPDEYWMTVAQLMPEHTEERTGLDPSAGREEWQNYMASGGSVLIAQSKEDPDAFFLIDLFSNIPWLEDGVPVPSEQIMDEQELSDLLES